MPHVRALTSPRELTWVLAPTIGAVALALLDPRNPRNAAEGGSDTSDLMIRMRTSLLVGTLSLTATAFAACSGTAKPAGEPDAGLPPTSVPSSTSAADGGDGAASPRDAAPDGARVASEDAGVPDLYDPAIVPRFELTLDAEAIAVLSSTAVADRKSWAHGTFRYGGVVIADVGVRRKGSSTFRALPQKAALKIRFDKYVPGQRFQGLTELTLNNMVSDPTALVERLAYHVFRSAGLPALRANTAELTINGETYGPYANLETPNEDLLRRLYGTRANTLYDVDYGSTWTGGSDLGFNVDVGDGTRADLHLLFADVVATRDPTLLAGVAARLDTTELLRYCAAEATTGHHDGYAYGIYGSHNYLMAGDKSGRFTLLPWSTDLTFSDRHGVPNAANPMPAETTAPGDTLLGRCKQSPSCWTAYKGEVSSVLATYEALGLEALARAWHSQIDPSVRGDPKRETPISYYDSETTLLYSWIRARPARVRAQLGLPP